MKLTKFIRSPSLLLVLMLSAPVGHAKTVDVEHEIEPQGAVRIDVLYGEVRIVAGEPGRVRVRGEIGDKLKRVALDRQGGAVELRVRAPLSAKLERLWQEKPNPRDLKRFWDDEPLYRADLEVEIPADTRLFLVSRDAYISISGIEGPIGVGVVTSDVVIRGNPAWLDVETVSGSLDFEGKTSRLAASTMSGRLSARGIGGKVAFDSVTGAIVVRDAHLLNDVLLRTVAGDIEIEGTFEDGSRLELASDSGVVTLYAGRDQGLTLDLDSQLGTISNEVTSENAMRTAQGHHRLQSNLGKPSAVAKVRTRTGDIRVVFRTEQ